MRREKAEEFRQHCYQNSSAQNAARSVWKKKAIVATPLPKKEKKKKFVLVIVAMRLPKMEKKIMKSVNE